MEILGPSKITYCGAGDDVKPLISCGARVVIETESDVRNLDWFIFIDMVTFLIILLITIPISIIWVRDIDYWGKDLFDEEDKIHIS